MKVIIYCFLFSISISVAFSDVRESLNHLISNYPYYYNQNDYDIVLKDLKQKIESGNRHRIYLALDNKKALKEVTFMQKEAKRLNDSLNTRNCLPVDLRNDALGKTRDQGEIGWCIGHTAADLMTFELGKRASAEYLIQSLKMKEGFNDANEFVGGGSLYSALLNINEKGYCLEEDFDFIANARYNANSRNYSLREVFIELEKLQLLYHKDLEANKIKKEIPSIFHRLVDFVYSSDDEVKESPLCDSLYIIRRVLPEVNLSLMKEAIKTGTFQDYLREVLKNKCSKLKKLDKDLEIASAGRTLRDVDSELEKLDFIDDALDGKHGKAKIVGIVYDGGSLYQRNLVFKSPNHASTIVARKIHHETGRCMYLVRNTWGNTYKRDDDSEEGNIWMTDSEIASVVDRVYKIK